MATITIRGFIHVQADFGGSPQFDFMKVDDMSQYGWTCIGPHEITVEVPDNSDFLPRHLENMQRIRAAALDEAARAEREIAQLSAVAKPD